MLHTFRQKFLKTFSITRAHMQYISNTLQQSMAFFNESTFHRVLTSNLI